MCYLILLSTVQMDKYLKGDSNAAMEVVIAEGADGDSSAEGIYISIYLASYLSIYDYRP